MVPPRLASAAGRRAAAALALILLAGCGRDPRTGGRVIEEEDPAGAFGALVRARYAGDLRAAGLWVWAAPDGATFALVDVQSTTNGLVQARLDLWLVADSGAAIVGRSDVMPSAAEIGAYAVADLTNDGLPDLFGYVADSADVRYPVFLPGSRGSLVDVLAVAAPGWRFDVHEPNEPGVVDGTRGACALRIWAEDPAPDGRGAGWRWLRLQRDGQLEAPAAEAPACP